MTLSEFTKMQVSGNDFVVVRETSARRNWAKLAPVLCHRRFGIGADGVLVVLPSKKADLRVRVVNADGSEAEVCGNGLISMGIYAIESGMVEPDRSEVSIETMAGVKRAYVLEQTPGGRRVRVNMGIPRFEPEALPVLVQGPAGDIVPVLDYPLFVGNRKLLLSFVSMGNPHAVMFTAKPLGDFPLTWLGPIVERHPLFPLRVNFEVARVLGRGSIEARVWERGAGETLACGSGACAIAVTARSHGYVDDLVEVTLPGGKLSVEWDGRGEALLSGNAETVFTGKWQHDGV